MIEVLLFIGLGIAILVLFEVRARKEARLREANGEEANSEAMANNSSDDGCCGQHLVCERETLLQTNAEIIYYDDEELDQLADINPIDFTEKQHQLIRDVFETLQEKDVPGWCRSIQLRHIELPQDIREEALLIVRERRKI